MKCWGKATWFFFCEIQIKPRKKDDAVMAQDRV